MSSYPTMATLIEAIAAEGRLGEPPVTALYPSAGSDSYQYTFLHPEFLARRGIDQVPAPSVFVLVDRRDQDPPEFDDRATRIETLESEPVRAGGLEMRVDPVVHASDTFADRELTVIAVTADNRAVQPVWHREGWVSDLFIGVCDGCAFGGNPRQACVDRLDVPSRMPQAEAEAVRIPRWWVTDHFRDAKPFAELGVGEIVESIDPRFPFVFRKLALLASDWGRYGGPVMAGATMFEAEHRRGVS